MLRVGGGRRSSVHRTTGATPSFYQNFINGSALDGRFAYTGSNGTFFNSSGTLTAATTNVPRIDYDPATLLCRGFLIEEARTNSIRNNTMVGASAGTPGTDPTNWVTSAVAGSITSKSIIGVGTENGISYIDYRFTFSGAVSAAVQCEFGTTIVANIGENWTGSVYAKLVGGSLTNIQMQLVLAEATAAGSFLAATTTNFTPTAAGLSTQRYSGSRTLNQATVARVYPAVFFTASGAADVTVRIGMPQLELGAFATSVISTSSAAVTRTADIASITGASFSSFWNATQGTFVVAGISPTLSTAGFLFNVNDTSSNNAIFTRRNASNQILTSVVTGGVSQADIGSTTITNMVLFKNAFAYAVNDFSQSTNGSAVATDTSGTVPTVTQMNIGSNLSAANWFNGWISSLAYYPVAFPASQLQAASV